VPQVCPRYWAVLHMSLRKLLSRAKDIVQYLRTGSIYEVEEVTVNPWEDDDDLGPPDCTEKFHRRYCRHFDREVKEIYWLLPDEVTEIGQYVMYLGGFHVPKIVNVTPNPHNGELSEFTIDRCNAHYKPLDPNAMYLGPFPRVPAQLDEW
jgi:hypothetical protein